MIEHDRRFPSTVATAVGLIIILVSTMAAMLSPSRDANSLVASINGAILGLAVVIVARR